LLKLLSEELELSKSDSDDTFIVVEIFEVLCQIEIVIKEKFISIDKHVDKMHTIVVDSTNKEMTKSAIKFLIYFYVTSFKLNLSQENYKLFESNNSSTEDKLFSLIQYNHDEDIKFGVCLIFFCISIEEKIWTKLTKMNITAVTSNFILNYLIKFFRVYNQKVKNLEKNERVNELDWPDMIIYILRFISWKDNYRRVYHVDYFKDYFHIVLFLFGLNLREWRHDILIATNVYTYYYECKQIFLEIEDNKCVKELYVRIANTFSLMKRLSKLYSECRHNINDLDRRYPSSSTTFKTKFQENSQLYEETAKTISDIFLNTVQSFTTLLSILVNLLVTRELRSNRNKIILKEEFFPSLKKANELEIYEEKQKKKEMMNISQKNGTTAPNDIVKFEEIDFTKINLENFEKFLKNEQSSNIKQTNKSFNQMNVTMQNNTLGDSESSVNTSLQGSTTNGNKHPEKSTSLIHETQKSIQVKRCQCQITLGMLIYNPDSVIDSTDKSAGFYEKDKEVAKLEDLNQRLHNSKSEEDVFHKLIYATNRFIERKTKFKELIESIKTLIKLIKEVLFKENSMVMVNRECMRLLITLTTYAENTYMWLKLDNSKKVHVDYANFSDVILVYKDKDTIWNEEGSDLRKRLIFTPHMKVKAYADKMGVIFYDDHVLVLPNPLRLGNEFTIWFRFFNPVINNNQNWHVLLQDTSGIGSLICIDPTKRKLGLFDSEGNFEDSGIELDRVDLHLKWLQVCLSYKSKIDPKDKCEYIYIEWFLNGKPVLKSDKKVAIPKNIQYIGNSRDFSEPFGVFCDLRVYRTCLDREYIDILYKLDETGRKAKNDTDLINTVFQSTADHVIEKLIVTEDCSEESFYFTIKFINNLLAMRGNRSKFINYNFIMRVNKFLKSSKAEIKKDVCKFLQTLS
jgi:hypothetical protein